jgi:hypothetical protein
MKDGRTITGRRLNEDTKTVQVIDSQEKLMSILKRFNCHLLRMPQASGYRS